MQVLSYNFYLNIQLWVQIEKPINLSTDIKTGCSQCLLWKPLCRVVGVVVNVPVSLEGSALPIFSPVLIDSQ